MPLVIRRIGCETWRETAGRYGRWFGVADEVLVAYDAEVARGVPEGRAAWNACYEWDVLDYDPEYPANENVEIANPL